MEEKTKLTLNTVHGTVHLYLLIYIYYSQSKFWLTKSQLQVIVFVQFSHSSGSEKHEVFIRKPFPEAEAGLQLIPVRVVYFKGLQNKTNTFCFAEFKLHKM